MKKINIRTTADPDVITVRSGGRALIAVYAGSGFLLGLTMAFFVTAAGGPGHWWIVVPITASSLAAWMGIPAAEGYTLDRRRMTLWRWHSILAFPVLRKAYDLRQYSDIFVCSLSARHMGTGQRHMVLLREKGVDRSSWRARIQRSYRSFCLGAPWGHENALAAAQQIGEWLGLQAIDEREQHAGQVSSEAAASASPDEPSA